MRKLFNRAMAFIVIVGAIYYWARAEYLRRKHGQHPRYLGMRYSHMAEVYEMRGDAIAARASRYWHGRKVKHAHR